MSHLTNREYADRATIEINKLMTSLVECGSIIAEQAIKIKTLKARIEEKNSEWHQLGCKHAASIYLKVRIKSNLKKK